MIERKMVECPTQYEYAGRCGDCNHVECQDTGMVPQSDADYITDLKKECEKWEKVAKWLCSHAKLRCDDCGLPRKICANMTCYDARLEAARKAVEG